MPQKVIDVLQKKVQYIELMSECGAPKGSSKHVEMVQSFLEASLCLVRTAREK